MVLPRGFSELCAFKVDGLVILVVLSKDENKNGTCFIRLREERERLHQEESDGLFWDMFFIGISVEFECKIEEGVTEVRDDYSIFSPCSQSDVYCWPV